MSTELSNMDGQGTEMSDNDKMREGFEKSTWHRYNFERNDLGFYCDPDLENAWKGWKACHAQSQQEVTQLRSEVAMLREFLYDLGMHSRKCVDAKGSGDCICGLDSALDNTKATAQVHDKKMKREGAVEALKEAAKYFDNDLHLHQMNGSRISYELKCMANTIYATSKKG